jgi:capsular exopolysaccharide synthesis family protein
MSRIQDIMRKAERDGTIRRTQGTPADPPVATLSPPRPDSRREGARSEGQYPDALRADVPGMPVTATLSPLLVAGTMPHALVAEQYRALRTRIAQSENGHARRVLIVSSPTKGDGKSITSANLALTMSQEFNRSVVLVDADLRQPLLHTLLGIPSAPGLSEVLQGAAALEDVLLALPEHRLTVLPGGTLPENPAELLGSTAMRRVLEALRARFDRVLIDTPPAQPLADVGVLAPMTDGLILVVRADVTPKPAIERALGVCDSSRIVGLVLNNTGGHDAGYGYEPYRPGAAKG